MIGADGVLLPGQRPRSGACGSSSVALLGNSIRGARRDWTGYVTMPPLTRCSSVCRPIRGGHGTRSEGRPRKDETATVPTNETISSMVRSPKIVRYGLYCANELGRARTFIVWIIDEVIIRYHEIRLHRETTSCECTRLSMAMYVCMYCTKLWRTVDTPGRVRRCAFRTVVVHPVHASASDLGPFQLHLDLEGARTRGRGLEVKLNIRTQRIL